MRKTFFLVIFFTNILIFSASAYSFDWKYIGTSNDGNECYVDFESIRYDATTITFWMKWVEKERIKIKSFYSINCLNYTFAVRKIIEYHPEGAIVVRASNPDKELQWLGIIPNSMIETPYKTLCKDR